MKKIISITMALMLMLSAVACGSKSDNKNENNTQTQTENQTENASVSYTDVLTNAFTGEASEILMYFPVISNSTIAMRDLLTALINGEDIDIDKNKDVIQKLADSFEKTTKDEFYNQEPSEDDTDDDKEYLEMISIEKNALLTSAEILRDLAAKSGNAKLEITDENKEATEIAFSVYEEKINQNIDIIFGATNEEESYALLSDAEGKKINPSTDLEEFAISVSPLMTQVHTVAIFKPAEGKEEFVYNVLNQRVETSKEQFETYLADQYEIAKAAKITKLDDGTVVLVMTENAEEVYENIIKALK